MGSTWCASTGSLAAMLLFQDLSSLRDLRAKHLIEPGEQRPEAETEQTDEGHELDRHEDEPRGRRPSIKRWPAAFDRRHPCSSPGRVLSRLLSRMSRSDYTLVVHDVR